MMTPPHNLRRLLEYLARHPRVQASCDDPKFPSGPRTFLRYEAGRLWFADPQQDEMFLPLSCRMNGDETGLLIDEKGFTVEKFGRSFRYDFLEGPAA
jgi:hypothetical protein